MDVGAFLVSDAQPAILVEPSKASLDNPAPSTQSTAMFGVTLCYQGQHMPMSQTLADCLRIITTVA